MDRDSFRFYMRLLLFCVFYIVMIIGMGEVIIRHETDHETALIHDTLLSGGSMITQDIQKKISSGIQVIEILDTLLKTHNYEVEDFDKWGETIVRSSLYASVVDFAPDGVISMVYPLEGNEEFLGFNILNDTSSLSGARIAILDKEVFFVGPVKLSKDDRYAVIARKPVFRQYEWGGEFWGFCGAVIYIEDILPEVSEKFLRQGFAMRIEGEELPDGSRPLLMETSGFNEENVIEMPIQVPRGSWTLSLSHRPIFNRNFVISRIIMWIFSFIVISYVIYQRMRDRKRSKEIIELNRRLTDLSLTDELTGVGNRRYAISTLDNLVAMSRRYGRSFSVAMIDLDFFKEINDTHGHLAGDEFLRYLSKGIFSHIRDSDFLFRLGGDEFLIVLPLQDRERGRMVCEKVVAYFRGSPLKWKNIEIPVSLSIGGAEYKSGEETDDLLHRADIQLYKVKEAGRNGISFDGE